MSEPKFDYCPHQGVCKVCQFFEHYAVKVLINTYCQGDYGTCKRYQLREAGQAVPDDWLPTGPQYAAMD
ncbi:MAG: uracil-DNA glycosylase [Anaerolineae bacterium]|nr:uracil-DNA glycosylase [Anaerolineae bacterium]